MNANESKELAEKVLEVVGGEGNVTTVNHCYTRLRLTLNKKDGINEEALKAIPGVVGVVVRDNDYQIVIGPDVSTVYLQFLTLGEFQEGKKIEDENADTEKGGNVAVKVLDFIGGTFSPVIPVLIAGGLTGAVLTVLTNFFGVTADSGTYIVFSAIQQAAFFFLPVFIGFSAARKLNVNPFLGALLGCILVSSQINGVDGLSFVGIPIHMTTYSSTVFPILLGVAFMAIVYKLFERILHPVLKTVFLPLLTMIVTVPITLIILGPIGDIVGTVISNGIYSLYEMAPPIAVMVIGAATPFLVFFGMNNALYPILFAIFAAENCDPLIVPGMLATNIAVGAVALAVGLKSKKPEIKSVAIGAGVTGLLGITEPAVYGVLFPQKRPLITASISAGIAGLLAGLFSLKGYAIVSPSFASIISFIPADGELANFYYAIIVSLVALVVGFVSTWFFGYKEEAV